MSYSRLTLLLTLLLATSLSALAANLGQVKAAMQARQPAIEALWAEGSIGENNQGFLEARGTLSAAAQQLMQAENTARRVAYQAIARSTQSPRSKSRCSVRCRSRSAPLKDSGCRMPRDNGIASRD